MTRINLSPALAIILFPLFSTALYGQDTGPEFNGHEWEAPYSLPVPEGWTIERFPVPISFAPEIPYAGVEDIRFPPGWAKAKSDEYWSYAFLWYLDGKIRMNPGILKRNLKVYYEGLIEVNGANIPVEKLIPVVTAFKGTEREEGDLKTFAGTIKMTDYIGKQPILLYCKAHLKSCPGEDKTFIFYELSPQPLTHAVWQSLDQLWLDFKCEKD